MRRPSLPLTWLGLAPFLVACASEAPPPGATGGGSGSAGASTGSAAGSSGTGGSAAGRAGASNGTGGASGAGSAGVGSAGAPTGGFGNAGAGAGGVIGAGAPGGGSGGARAGTAGVAGVAGRAGASGGEAGTGTAGAGGGAAGTHAAGAGGMGPTLPPVTDYTKSGPFETTTDRNVGPGGTYTVFRPSTLGEGGFLHAPIVFGPGIGQQVTVHTTMLTNFASHGFVVVGCPVLNGGPGDAANRKTMQDGLDWIVAQNSMAGIYQGKLYADHAVSMGFSVGGTSAVEIGGDEAVALTVSIHGHKASAALHGPLLQTTGTQDTVGMPLQQQTYDQSQVQTFLGTLTGAPHQYIESNGGGEERPAILAWMRLFIYRDEGARRYFYGDDCVLCEAPWENPQRKAWPP